VAYFTFSKVKIFWRFNSVSQHLAEITEAKPSDAKSCQLLSIIYRKRLAASTFVSPNDFIWWHDEFVESEVILDPHWTLYTMDEKFIYFLQMPNPWPFYNVRRATFLFVNQLADATKLARIPLKEFCRLTEINLTNPKGPVIFFTMVPRSGSTLFTKAMQVFEEKIVCFSELAIFHSFAALEWDGSFDESLAVDLASSIFKFFCRTQQSGQAYFFKTLIPNDRVVRLIKKGLPQIKNVFGSRRNMGRVLNSFEKILRGPIRNDIFVALWKIWPKIVPEFFSYSGELFELFDRFGIDDVLDVTIIRTAAAIYHYHRCQDIFDLPVIYYENMIEKKEETLRSVFQLCDLPYDEFIGEALKTFDYDSQSDTTLSQEKMKVVKPTPLDESRLQKIYYICDQLSIPRFEIP